MFRFFSLFLFLLFSFWAQAQNHSVQVDVSSILPATGNLRVGVYNSSLRFPEEDATFMNKIIPIDSISLSFTFTEIPEGTYCISMYHDKNSNNKFDFNFIGYPLETYGFSNNVFPLFRAPTFEECSVYIDKDMKVSIILDK